MLYSFKHNFNTSLEVISNCEICGFLYLAQIVCYNWHLDKLQKGSWLLMKCTCISCYLKIHICLFVTSKSALQGKIHWQKSFIYFLYFLSLVRMRSGSPCIFLLGYMLVLTLHPPPLRWCSAWLLTLASHKQPAVKPRGIGFHRSPAERDTHSCVAEYTLTLCCGSVLT